MIVETKATRLKKVKIISHSDLDGHGGPILMKDVLLSADGETEFNVEHITDYSKVDKAIMGFIHWKEAPAYDAFYIMDLSMNNAETANALDEFASKHPKMHIHLIDHHDTALWLNAYDWARVIVNDKNDLMHSATDLVYDYLINELIPFLEQHAQNEEGRNTWMYTNQTNAFAFADIIRSYDTYAWKNEQDNKHKEQARDFNQLFYLLGGPLFVQRMGLTGLDISMQPHEKFILEVDSRKRDFYLSKKKKQVQLIPLNDKDNFAFVTAESEKNDVCDMMSELYPEAVFVLLRDHDKLSFRVRGHQYKVNRLAKFFEGGGHDYAAGGRVKNPDNVSNERLIDKVTKYYNQLLEVKDV